MKRDYMLIFFKIASVIMLLFIIVSFVFHDTIVEKYRQWTTPVYTDFGDLQNNEPILKVPGVRPFKQGDGIILGFGSDGVVRWHPYNQKQQTKEKKRNENTSRDPAKIKKGNKGKDGDKQVRPSGQ